MEIQSDLGTPLLKARMHDVAGNVYQRVLNGGIVFAFRKNIFETGFSILTVKRQDLILLSEYTTGSLTNTSFSAINLDDAQECKDLVVRTLIEVAHKADLRLQTFFELFTGSSLDMAESFYGFVAGARTKEDSWELMRRRWKKIASFRGGKFVPASMEDSYDHAKLFLGKLAREVQL